MKTLKITILTLSAALMLAACGSQTPKSVAERFVKAGLDFDYKAAAKLATKEYSDEILDEIGRMSSEEIKELTKEKREENKGISFVVTKVEAEGNEATVQLKITLKNGRTNTGDVELVKEDGEWKVKEENLRFH